jgi:HAD superfamily hydrolase (TIGR01484 family)
MILVCDIDGTFWQHFDTDFEIYHKNAAAAKRWRESGHLLILATGRGLPSMRRNFSDITDYADFLITDNGSFTTELSTGKLIDEIVFEPRQIGKITAFARDLYPERLMLISYHGYLQEYRYPLAAIGKIRTWMRDGELAEKLYERLEEEFGPGTLKLHVERNALPSSLPWVSADYKAFVNITPNESGKEQALARLIKQKKLKGEVFTLGDDLNDLGMIKHYEGYAMRDSHPRLLEQMDKDRLVDNPAELINKLLKSQEK